MEADDRSRAARRAFLLRCAAASVAVSVTREAGAVKRPEPKDSLRKRTREEVKYQDEPYLGRTCARCVLYQGHGVCVILADPVSPNGWCSQWVPATMG